MLILADAIRRQAERDSHRPTEILRLHEWRFLMRVFQPTRHPPLLLLILALCAFTAFGDEPRSQRETHEPFTFNGFRLRSNIAVPVPGIWGPRVVSMGPALFQEVPPCQF